MTADHPNVLVVVMDSVRAQNLGLYGYERETTPFLERFADRSTVYHDAVSPGVWSLPSHVSMLTGLHVEEHGIDTVDDRLAPGHTFVEDLSDRGYDTGVFSQNVWLTQIDDGIPAVFDDVYGSEGLRFPDALDPYSEEFDGYREFVRMALAHDRSLKSVANGVLSKLEWDYPSAYALIADDQPPAAAYLERFLEWSDDRDRWAAVVNLMDAHSPYRPSDRFDRWADEGAWETQERIEDGVWEFLCGGRAWEDREALIPLYDGSIRQIDHCLERAIGALSDRDELDDTLVVVTSDHGEGFGERSRLEPGWRAAGHVLGLHRVQTHVPLLVNHPGQRERDDVEEWASLTELPSIVRGAINGERRSAVPDGPVVSSSFGLQGEIKTNRAERYCTDAREYCEGTRAAHFEDPHRRYVERAGHELVSVGPSPDDHDDWAGVDPVEDDGEVERVFEKLIDRGVKEATAGLSGIDETTRRNLDELGYL